MKAAELQRIKEFYRQATADQQCTVRNMIAGHYYDEIHGLFSQLGIDGEDFCEGAKTYEEIPDPIWQLLEHDVTIETVEDLAAADVLWFYEHAIKSQVSDQQFERAIEGSLKDLRHKAFAAGADKKQLGQIDSEIEAQRKINNHSWGFNFQQHTDRLLKSLPILDKKIFLEQANILVRMREGAVMGRGQSERAKG